MKCSDAKHRVCFLKNFIYAVFRQMKFPRVHCLPVFVSPLPFCKALIMVDSLVWIWFYFIDSMNLKICKSLNYFRMHYEDYMYMTDNIFIKCGNSRNCFSFAMQCTFIADGKFISLESSAYKIVALQRRHTCPQVINHFNKKLLSGLCFIWQDAFAKV